MPDRERTRWPIDPRTRQPLPRCGQGRTRDVANLFVISQRDRIWTSNQRDMTPPPMRSE